MNSRVTRILDAAGINYEIRLHSKDVFTVEEAAQERGVRPAQLVKVMVVRLSGNRLIAVLLPGDRRLDLKKLRLILGEKRLALATHEEIEQTTGYPVGAVSPIGLPAEMPLYMDTKVLEEESIAISAGRPDAGVVLKSADLQQLLRVELGNFS